MAKILKIVSCVFCSVACLVCIAMAFLEARLLFSGDWLIYHNPLNGFIRYFLRFALALLGLATYIAEIISLKKFNKIVHFFSVFVQIGIIIFSVLACFLTANFIGIICLALSLIIFNLKLLINISRRQKVAV